MSKYTTEVRFICETLAGYNSSQGYGKVSDILDECWDKVFDFDFPIYDENYRSVLCKKILKHYYTREIGLETVGLWKLKLDTKMNEIMPYYNERYRSADLSYNPLHDVDYTRVTNGDETGENSRNNEGSNDRVRSDSRRSNSRNSESSVNDVTDKYSDTPQGGLTGLKNDNYLTSARIANGSNNNIGEREDRENSDVNENAISSNKENGNFSTTKEYIEHVVGKMGTGSYAKAISEFRNAIINVDIEIIDELDELFMKLW